MPRSNKFIRARHHLSSTQIDERIRALNEGPTNNTSGYYVIEPDVVTVIPAVRSDLDLTADDPALIGKDTSGLFDSNGDPLSEMPPGDTSFILGPMVSVYFPDGDYSAIGYIQKDTRKVINLARIPGTVGDWGVGGNTEGFTSYSQLTLEQALWYRDNLINGNTSQYRIFYIGVFEQLNSEPNVSDPSTGVDIDEFGRWLGNIINIGKTLIPGYTETTPGKKGPDPDMPSGIANPLLSLVKGIINDLSDPVGVINDVGNLFKNLIDSTPEIATQTIEKYAQLMATPFGFKLGLVGAISADINTIIQKARFGGDTEVFLRGGEHPVIPYVTSPIQYAANLAMSLSSSIGNGKTIMINNQNLPPSVVGSQLRAQDIETALGIHGVAEKAPRPIGTDPDSILNPNRNGNIKQNYFGPTGFGQEGGSILEPFIGKDGVPMLRNTADKTLRLGGKSGEGFDIDTQTFTDIPSGGDTLPSIIGKVIGSDVAAQYVSSISDMTPEEASAALKGPLGNQLRQQAGSTLSSTNPAGGYLKGKGTGTLNAAAAGALVYGEIKKVFGQREGTPLESAGGHGHVRRETVMSINDLSPQARTAYINYLDNNGIKYNLQQNEEKNYRKKILSEVKKPYNLPELKKEKIKHRPKVIGCDKTKVVGDGLMKKAEVPTSFKRLEDTMWKKQERKNNERFSQERKNMILDSVGTSDHAWTWMTERNHTKSSNSMYENFGSGQKNQIISKKKVGNDYIIKMYNEEGKVEIITQSVLNERLQRQHELIEQETLNAPNDPLVKRVKKALSIQIDYPDKPSKMGYPDKPPLPQSETGYHAEYGKKKDYYKRLDRYSADTMDQVRTGDIETDQQVYTQTTSSKIKDIVLNKRKNK